MADAALFATARRGAVSLREVDEVRDRIGQRATSAQVAKILGRCEADVRAIMFPKCEDPASEAKVVASVSFDWDERALRLSGAMFDMECTPEEVSRAVGCTSDEAKTRKLQVVRINRRIAA